MTAVNIRGRGLGQDGNAPFADLPGAVPLGIPSIGIPSAQARAGLPVSSGAGFNWRSIHDERVVARRRLPTVMANALTTRAGSWYPSNLYGTVRTRGSGLGQSDGAGFWDVFSKGIETAGKAFQTYQTTDLQSQILQNQLLLRGVVPPGTTTVQAGVSTTNLMPILLVGGAFMVMMMMARR